MTSLRVAVCAVALVIACGTNAQGPRWVESLVSQLECGMSLHEVESLTNGEIRQVDAKRNLGTHRVDGKRAHVWLGFEEQGLVTVTAGHIEGLTSIRRTPKRNLCTGELTFIVSVEWIERLEGADVYWDGRLVQEKASSGLVLEVTSGQHELRIQKEGYEPIVRHLDLGPEDRGDQRIDLLEDELRRM